MLLSVAGTTTLDRECGITCFLINPTINVMIDKVRKLNSSLMYSIPYELRGSRGRDRTLVGFTTTCAIRAYHH